MLKRAEIKTKNEKKGSSARLKLEKQHSSPPPNTCNTLQKKQEKTNKKEKERKVRKGEINYSSISGTL